MTNLNKAILAILTILLFMCSPLKPNQERSCDKIDALQITDRRFKRKGFKEELYRATMEEDSLHFFITYSVKEGYGGGANFTVSKKDCTIIDQLFQQ